MPAKIINQALARRDIHAMLVGFPAKRSKLSILSRGARLTDLFLHEMESEREKHVAVD
jgi:hypothetical protein